jgi:hypothetical protein
MAIDVTDEFCSAKSTELPRILSVLTGTTGQKVRLAAMFVLESALKKSAFEDQKSASFMPLVKFLVNEKSAVLADPDNVVVLVGKFAADKFSSRKSDPLQLLGSLLSLCIAKENARLFCSVSPIFSPVKSVKTYVATIAGYGSAVLQGEEGEEDDSNLATILTVYLSSIVDNAQDAKCWKFIRSVVESRKTVVVNNVRRPAAVLALEIMARTPSVSEVADKILCLLVELRAECDDGDVLMESRNVVRGMDLKISAFKDKLHEIWGDTAASPQKAKRSPTKRTAAIKVEDDDTKWLKTYFLVELLDAKDDVAGSRSVMLKPLFHLLKRSIGNDDGDTGGNAYAVDLFLSSIHAAIENMGADELSGRRPYSRYPHPHDYVY